jgi:hypothetical protein
MTNERSMPHKEKGGAIFIAPPSNQSQAVADQ